LECTPWRIDRRLFDFTSNGQKGRIMKKGINMKEWCRNQESKIENIIEEKNISEKTIYEFKEKIKFLQHERLIHLIVIFIVVITELFTTEIVLLHPDIGIIPAIIMLGLAILLGFYFYHYFILENTTQRWYKLLEIMQTQNKETYGHKK
jgi:hypothetical protein